MAEGLRENPDVLVDANLSVLEDLGLDAVAHSRENLTSEIIDAFRNDSPCNSQLLSITIKDVLQCFLGAHQRNNPFDLLGFGAVFILHRLAYVLLYLSKLLKAGFSI